MFQILLEERQIGGCILQNRLLAQIILHHLGHEIIDAEL